MSYKNLEKNRAAWKAGVERDPGRVARYHREARADPTYRRMELDRDNAARRADRAADPEKWRAKDRLTYKNNKEKWDRNSLKNLYGITPVEKWTRLFGDQNGHCANPACCKTGADKNIRWHVHHIHGSDPMAWCVTCLSYPNRIPVGGERLFGVLDTTERRGYGNSR